MLAGILRLGQEETPRAPILPEAAVMRLAEHLALYEKWLHGPSPWRSGDIVTWRREAPIGQYDMIMLVTEVDRSPVVVRQSPVGSLVDVSLTTPPPRSRKTGLREDTRVVMIGDDPEASLRCAWVEGWMLEAWSAEQAEQLETLRSAEAGSGRAQ